MTLDSNSSHGGNGKSVISSWRNINTLKGNNSKAEPKACVLHYTHAVLWNCTDRNITWIFVLWGALWSTINTQSCVKRLNYSQNLQRLKAPLGLRPEIPPGMQVHHGRLPLSSTASYFRSTSFGIDGRNLAAAKYGSGNQTAEGGKKIKGLVWQRAALWRFNQRAFLEAEADELYSLCVCLPLCKCHRRSRAPCFGGSAGRIISCSNTKGEGESTGTLLWCLSHAAGGSTFHITGSFQELGPLKQESHVILHPHRGRIQNWCANNVILWSFISQWKCSCESLETGWG